jgi:hypothetical protein
MKKKPYSSAWDRGSKSLKIQEKFFGRLSRYYIPFFRTEKIFRFFLLQLVPGTTIHKKILNT